MNTLARYWHIWRINPAAENKGYTQISIAAAQEFINNELSDVEISNIQNTLLSYFKNKNSNIDVRKQALAGLCLRCYTSEAILKECKKIDYIYSGDKQFTYRDLLPFVLNDDGKKLIILDENKQKQLILDKNFREIKLKHEYFSVKVLETFKTDLQPRMSLDNWAYLQTKQNGELKKFLSELGLKHLSDWAILNRITKEQFLRLSLSERCIVEVYHAVYRRERRQKRIASPRKCPDPNSAQLNEMLVYLQQKEVIFNTELQLLEELKKIALQLRNCDIYNSTEYFDIYEAQNYTYISRNYLYTNGVSEVDIEQQEVLQFLQQHLNLTLSEAIKQEIAGNIQRLQNSSRYQPFAEKYLRGLLLYYRDSMSLKEITPILEMTSWNQARRILNPGEMLSQVRVKTTKLMLESILQLAVEKGLTQIPPEVNYFNNLIEEIESYLDREIFQQANEENRTGRNRQMNSAYAKAVCDCIDLFH